MSDLKSKGGATIEKGDTVYTKIRGGRHEGEVEQLITSEEDMKDVGQHKGKQHAPAVVFHDQNSKKVAHDPSTLNDLDKEK